MDRASQAFADPRNHMVDSQVRPNKVTDPRILAAMRHLPRERFIPDDLAALAYADADVPLGAGRVLIEPMVIARLLQLTAVAVGERTLVVGAGTGYAAANLHLGARGAAAARTHKQPAKPLTVKRVNRLIAAYIAAHHGLRNLHMRAEEAGGALTVRSNTGGGTTITAAIPSPR